MHSDYALYYKYILTAQRGVLVKDMCNYKGRTVQSVQVSECHDRSIFISE